MHKRQWPREHRPYITVFFFLHRRHIYKIYSVFGCAVQLVCWYFNLCLFVIHFCTSRHHSNQLNSPDGLNVFGDLNGIDQDKHLETNQITIEGEEKRQNLTIEDETKKQNRPSVNKHNWIIVQECDADYHRSRYLKRHTFRKNGQKISVLCCHIAVGISSAEKFQ